MAAFNEKSPSTSAGFDSSLPEQSGKTGAYKDLVDNSDGYSTASSESSPPKYDAVVNGASSSSSSGVSSGFHPTRFLQLETRGGVSSSTFSRQKPDPATIYEVSETGEIGAQIYASIRTSRSSTSCNLVRPGDTTETPLCSTTYRIGPYRDPKLQLLGHDDAITARGRQSAFSHKTTLDTPFGTLRWRYGGRHDRRAVNADNLLILEVLGNAAAGSSDSKWTRFGHLIRNDEMRSKGTTRLSGGNGGRLMLDLKRWADLKGATEQVEVLAVASCLLMLKKEVDRTGAANQAALLSATTGF